MDLIDLDNIWNSDFEIWEVKAGEVTAIKINDSVFIKEKKSSDVYILHKNKIGVHNIKLAYIDKYISTKEAGSVFTIEQFFQEFPLQRKNKKLSKHISRLINNQVILQLNNGRFKVLKEIKREENK